MRDFLTYEKDCLVRRLWTLSHQEYREGERIAIWLHQIRNELKRLARQLTA